MKTVQVKLGKPSKFFVNNKRISLNTAFGMYQTGAKFTLDGKKLNLNKFGVSQSAGHKIPPELVQKITLMTYGLDPHPHAKIIKKWDATKRFPGDNSNWSGLGRQYIGHPGFNRKDLMKMKINEIKDIMDNVLGPYDDFRGSDSYKTRMRDTMRWSSDDDDWYASPHPGGIAMDRVEVMKLNKDDREEYMSNLPRDADYWDDEY